ncbi:MAG: aldo/keto reductase, partial [Acidobacteriia bacterium]|nr:aldo/keto reductase [Terriglobia bacterium]
MSSFATPDGTARYAARFPQHDSRAFFRTAQGLHLSSLGLGSYLGNMDEATDDGYTRSTIAALQGGINVIDTSLNYRNQSSELNIGAALRQAALPRDEFAVCTKAGYLVPGAIPTSVTSPNDVAGGMHCMTP